MLSRFKEETSLVSISDIFSHFSRLLLRQFQLQFISAEYRIFSSRSRFGIYGFHKYLRLLIVLFGTRGSKITGRRLKRCVLFGAFVYQWSVFSKFGFRKETSAACGWKNFRPRLSKLIHEKWTKLASGKKRRTSAKNPVWIYIITSGLKPVNRASLLKKPTACRTRTSDLAIELSMVLLHEGTTTTGFKTHCHCSCRHFHIVYTVAPERLRELSVFAVSLSWPPTGLWYEQVLRSLSSACFLLAVLGSHWFWAESTF